MIEKNDVLIRTIGHMESFRNRPDSFEPETLIQMNRMNIADNDRIELHDPEGSSQQSLQFMSIQRHSMHEGRMHVQTLSSGNPVMSGDIIPLFQDIFFIPQLKWSGMMNHIRNSFRIPMV